MTRFVLSETQIRQGASEESFARGVHYYQGGAVGPLVLRDGLLRVEVAGSGYDPYHVTVSLDADRVRSASCTCPYDWGGWCKHIVATLLAYAHAEPGAVQVRPPLAELLANLNRDQLMSLLLRLAAGNPALTDRIEALVAAPSPVVVSPVGLSPATDSGRRTPVDVTAFQQQFHRIFRNQRYDNYMAYESILADLRPLVAQIRSFLDGGNAQNALLLLEVLTDDYSERWIDFDDSDGELGGFFDDLGELWAEALLAANPKKAERVRWRERLAAWAATADDYGCEGLNLALQAAEEGWSAPWVDAAILGEALPGTQPTGTHDSALIAIRLRILERSGQINEALNLAAAAGMYRDQALLLVRLDRGSEAVELGRQHFRTVDEALALAQGLRDRGDATNALTIGAYGLDLPKTVSASDPRGYAHEQERAHLGTWLVDLAAGQGRIDLALRAGEDALRIAPDLGLYRRLAELASEHWPDLRGRLLAALRTSTSWMISGRIDIFLHEELIDDAIAALGTHAAGADLVRVMDAATTTHPDWVIRMSTVGAEGIINPGDAKHYDSAVEWLRRARAAYQAAGQPEVWASYLQSLRTKHGRKHKLMELLNLLEQPRH